MTSFKTTSETFGRSDDVLMSAVATLTNNGFAITNRDAKSVSLTGPGLTSTRQNAILGATKITLRIDDNSIVADAELGGVDSMQRFLMRFPLLLGLSLALLFGVGGGLLFGQQAGVGFGVPWAPGWKWMLFAFGLSMLPVVPWLVISPLMAASIRSSTRRAIEILIRNAAFMAKPAGQ